MGRRGPKPAPTALRILRGDRPDRINRNEPKPPAGIAKPPEWLTGEALAKWNDLAPQLLTTGVLTIIDVEALARYCSIWQEWRKHLGLIQRGADVLVIRDNEGKVRYTQVGPSASLVNKYGAALLRLEQEFGLTPAARSSIRVGERAEPSDPLQAFLAKHNAHA